MNGPSHSGDIIRDTDTLQRHGYREVAQAIKQARYVAFERSDNNTLRELAVQTADLLDLVERGVRA